MTIVVPARCRDAARPVEFTETAAISDEIAGRLIAWVGPRRAIRELWLFGRRARGRATPLSGYDIGCVLEPATASGDFAMGLYFAQGGEWQREIEALVGRRVRLEAITHDTVDRHGERLAIHRLWARGA